MQINTETRTYTLLYDHTDGATYYVDATLVGAHLNSFGVVDGQLEIEPPAEWEEQGISREDATTVLEDAFWSMVNPGEDAEVQA